MLNKRGNGNKLLLGLCALAIATGLGVTDVISQEATAEAPQKADAKPAVTRQAVAGKPYFIEFRARSAHNYGHTFLVHGKVGQSLPPRMSSVFTRAATVPFPG